MKNTMLKSLVVATVVGMTLASTGSAMAEDLVGREVIKSADSAYTYEHYVYPSIDGNFLMHDDSSVTFDVKKGVYWQLAVDYRHYENGEKSKGGILSKLMPPRPDVLRPYATSVSFYTPDGQHIKTFDKVSRNANYCFPEVGTDIDHYVVRLNTGSTDRNWLMKFHTYSGVGDVVATPNR